ncbi:MAG: 50S ribosomal protein L10 [Fusobacteriia bacterium 4572_132]|nr:MAG: 50S ribosomal protein L10 [Fusobacteriia bacterium 4572_132]
MANQKKINAVKELKGKIEKAKSIIFVDYKGITVNEDTELRKKMKESGTEYLVAKNKLVRIALKEAGVEDSFDDALEGTTSFAIAYDDVVAPAKIAYEFGKGKEIFNIKAGLLDGKRMELDDVMALAKLPSRDELLAKLLFVIKGPISKLGYALNALKTKKEEEVGE